ncbi:MAG: HlyD family efflux transporter periplasmic adaptor subunit [bacterium]|nr:HlyD family efflux transporter periplasmic adaptor subunit [bacterium]
MQLSRITIGFIVVIFASCGGSGEPVAVGTLERDRIELRTEQFEPILELAVQEGDVVETGEVLVRLDERRATARVASSQAARDLAVARLAELVRWSRPEELAEGRARLEEARSRLIEIKPGLERARALVAEGVETLQTLDIAEAAHAGAIANQDAAAAALELLLNGATVEELDQAEAEVARAESELEVTRIQLERLVVRAPRGGRIDALPFKVGDEPPVGSTVVVLLPGGAPFARIYVPSELRPIVKAGVSVRISVEGIAENFEGVVRCVSSEAAFTPYFALTERDRGRLVYLAEIDLVGDAAQDLPTGLPVEVVF